LFERLFTNQVIELTLIAVLMDDLYSPEGRSFSQLSAAHGAAMLRPSSLPKICSGLFHVACTTGTSSFCRKSLNVLSHKVCGVWLSVNRLIAIRYA